MNTPNLLFSICVLTFNSEETIIETLESIKNIDYPNIELIISDDCSRDNTLYKCLQWLNKNKECFIRTNVLSVSENTSTSANCNRALRDSHGDWICLLAGDDVLYSDCVSKIIDYINANHGVQWIVGKYNKFSNRCIPDNFIKEGEEFNEDWKNIFSMSVKEQYKIILTTNFIYLPTAFCKRQILVNVGGYDEKYGILEDFPMNIKLLKNNIKCYLIDEYIMGYRVGTTNVCNNTTKLFNINHMRLRYNVLKDYCFEYYTISKRCNERLKLAIYNSLSWLQLDKKNTFNIFVFKSLLKFNDLIFRGGLINI